MKIWNEHGTKSAQTERKEKWTSREDQEDPSLGLRGAASFSSRALLLQEA